MGCMNTFEWSRLHLGIGNRMHGRILQPERSKTDTWRYHYHGFLSFVCIAGKTEKGMMRDDEVDMMRIKRG